MSEDEGSHVRRLERRVHELEVAVQPLAELGGAIGTLLRLAGSFTPPVRLKSEDEAQTVLPVFDQVDEAPPKEPQYIIREWRTWAGFRRNMQRREQIERDNQKANGTILEITKELLANQTGGDSVRNISRVMEDYGLDPRAWPPSTWSEEQPRGTVKHPHFRDLHSLVAAALLPALPLLLDVISDGRYNHVVSVLRSVGCEFGRFLG